MNEDILVLVVGDQENSELAVLAESLQLPIENEMPSDGFCLFMQQDMLSLIHVGDENQNALNIDFTSGAATHRREQGGGKNQAVGKAIGLNKKAAPYVLDATAGLGKDAFVLAGLGCTVKMVEQSPIVGALLQDALNRAETDCDIQHLVRNMSLVIGNSVNYMCSELLLKNPPDVVYLDPMYPERKKTAKVKKEMQILQKLLGHQDDLESLLAAALNCAKYRVVVKRPKGSSSLSAKSPTHIIESKKTRYDVYMCL